mgnify:CR=1 FL=1
MCRVRACVCACVCNLFKHFNSFKEVVLIFRNYLLTFSLEKKKKFNNFIYFLLLLFLVGSEEGSGKHLTNVWPNHEPVGRIYQSSDLSNRDKDSVVYDKRQEIELTNSRPLKLHYVQYHQQNRQQHRQHHHQSHGEFFFILF